MQRKELWQIGNEGPYRKRNRKRNVQYERVQAFIVLVLWTSTQVEVIGNGLIRAKTKLNVHVCEHNADRLRTISRNVSYRFKIRAHFQTTGSTLKMFFDVFPYLRFYARSNTI